LEEPTRLLRSIVLQEWPELELIVVDQNEDDRIEKLLREEQLPFECKYFKSTPGLSKARNLGLKNISGDIIAFPDDDCWYPDDFFKMIDHQFKENPGVSGFIGVAVNKDHIHSVGCPNKQAGEVSRYGILISAASACIFLTSELVRRVGIFDESLGLGAETPWGASEEADFLIRAYDQGFKLFFNPEIKLFHPVIEASFDSQYYERAYRYGDGYGRVLKKNHFSIILVGWVFFRTLGGIFLMLISFRFKMARYHARSLIGRLKGWSSS